MQNKVNSLNSEMNLSSNMQKQTSNDCLSPDEEKAIEQYETGDEKLKTYKTPHDLIKDLHRAAK